MNILDFIFVNLAFAVTFTGVLINNFEKYVPAFIVKSYRYGSFAYQGPEANFLQVIEIPKSYYRHFYLTSSIFSIVMSIYMVLVYFMAFNVNSYVAIVLQAIMQQKEPSVSVAAALLSMSLLTIQCLRRLYETYYLQVFAKTSKMNLTHYAAGIVHYFGCFIAIIGAAPLFSGDQSRENMKWTDSWTTMYSIPCIILFSWAFYEQYQSNIIFANLRKDKKSGKVITEEHRIPRGRMFENVSSPHRLCEIVIYTLLVLLIPTYTFFFIYLWVLSNQVQTAIQAHEWYKKSFDNYPPNRYAVLPYIL